MRFVITWGHFQSHLLALAASGVPSMWRCRGVGSGWAWEAGRLGGLGWACWIRAAASQVPLQLGPAGPAGNGCGKGLL